MTVKTIEAKELGLKPIKVSESMGLQKKVGELQAAVSKTRLDAQTEMIKVTRNANIISKLDPKKSEDQNTMKRIAEDYGVDFGPFDPTLWDVYGNAIGNILDVALTSLTSENSPKLRLKIADLELKFIEDIAGITTKKEKEKLENSDKFGTEEIDELTGKLVSAIMGTEGKEPTEEDSKSDS